MRLFPFLFVSFVGARAARYRQQIPIVEEHAKDVVGDLSDQSLHGIGVHFTTSYATAAIRYENGTFQDLIRVEGDADYVAVMSRWVQKRLASWAKPEEPDCETAKDKSTYTTQKSRPKSSQDDTAIMARFLHTVRAATEERTSFSITNIAPVLPLIGQTEAESFEESMTLAGLKSTRRQSTDDAFAYSDTNAAFAGANHGLCQDWKDPSSCRSEESLLPFSDVLFLSFDNSSFSASAQFMHSPSDAWSLYSYNIDTELGWWNLPIWPEPRANFFARIRDALLDVLSDMPRPPHKVILLGDHGAEKEFVDLAKTAIWNTFEFDASLMLQVNAKELLANIAARGAAELAWRNEYWSRQAALRGEDLVDGL